MTVTRRLSPELGGYLLLAAGLFALLWWRTSEVDLFYLDEWFYTHGSDHIWEHFPGAVLGHIPEWNRGPQRAYSALLAPLWGLFGASTAFTLSHVVNVLLMVSAIAPAALLARRVIDSAPLRVLAVALGVAIPWLTISAHLLTENLAFPVFLWAAYLIVLAAEAPSLRAQALAIGAIGLLGMVRLNLAPLFAVLVVAVLAAEIRHRREHRGEPFGAWAKAALRREALVVAATVLAGAAALALLLRGSGGLGAYGGFTFDTITNSLWGEKAELTRRTALTYARGLITGSFVLPFALGLGVALAGLFGRLGRGMLLPSLVTLGGLLVVLGGVSFWTAGAALEERYVFYAYTPVAVLAVAGLAHLARLPRWVAAGGALTLWAMVVGYGSAAANSGHFFAAPAGAFWTKVVHHRLRAYERDLLGWTLLGQTGWLLVAVGLAVLVAVVALARTRPVLVARVLTAGLAACALAQVANLDYSYKRELRGTQEFPGGIAGGPGHDADRETWVDAELPAGAVAGVVPGVTGLDGVYGGLDRMTFWNRELDLTIGTPWNGAAMPAPPGFGTIVTVIGADGLATFDGKLPPWIAAHVDDPRIQFAGELVERSPTSRFGLFRAEPRPRALWTASNVDGDGAVLNERPATLALDREAADGAGGVTLTLASPGGAPAGLRYRVAQDGRAVASGRIAAGAEGTVRLDVPPCSSVCEPVSWELSVVGPYVPTPFPAYGAPGTPRGVTAYLRSAEIG